jgi:enoyl-CoA hydratase
MSVTYQTITADDQDGITTITVNRPAALNALSRTVLDELVDLLESLGESEHRTTGVIVTGAGDRAFVAGADIAEMAAMSPDEGEAFGRLGQRVTTLFGTIPVPVVACVNGYALGGGCELAMGCDFIFATENAVFGQPEVSLGLIPGFGGCVRLARYVGPGRAKELIYSGRQVRADEALRIGLVNAVFPTKEEMLAAATASLTEIAAKSPAAVAICKETIDSAYGRPTAEALDLEAASFRRAFTTSDMREGTAAFLAKRTPSFAGE